MLSALDAASLLPFHDHRLADPAWPEHPSSLALPAGAVWGWVEANHRYNSLLWDEEDKARRTDVGHAAIAASKRLIDRHNQLRNDAVEAIDETILSLLATVVPARSARLNSETAGAMIDRLSILALKIFHMRQQTLRTDAAAGHLAACALKLQRLQTQRIDLAACLAQLLSEAARGQSYFKIYRQFKMYNDPSLNPYLYGQGGAGSQPHTPS